MLPGTSPGARIDDLTFSARLHRLIVPALGAGVDLVDPDDAKVTNLGDIGAAYSATEAEGMIFFADRREGELVVVDPASSKRLASARTRSTPDYVRYAPETGELWVTEPASPEPGIEIFRLSGDGGTRLVSVGFVALERGAEGLAISARRNRAYTHGDPGEILVIDIRSRTLVSTWPLGCSRTHGIPALDEEHGLLLAGCASGGEGVLLDVDHGGRRLGSYRAGGEEALLAFGASSGHFYLRGDPGRQAVVLSASSDGLRLIDKVEVPREGHCLAADDRSHYWTCDRRGGRLVRFTDRATP